MRIGITIVHAMFPGYRASSIILHIILETQEQYGFLTIVHVLRPMTKAIQMLVSGWNAVVDLLCAIPRF